MNGQIGTVETESFSIDYLRFGRGDDALVILPGASVVSVMGAADTIERAYAPLAEDFTVYLLDYRRDFPDAYSVRDMARDAYEAICALGLGRACLFGASLGGMVAQALAVDHPELVRKLALGSTAARRRDVHVRRLRARRLRHRARLQGSTAELPRRVAAQASDLAADHAAAVVLAIAPSARDGLELVVGELVSLFFGQRQNLFGRQSTRLSALLQFACHIYRNLSDKIATI